VRGLTCAARAQITAKLEKSVRPEIIHRGLNITGDSFYSSQGVFLDTPHTT
jgi:hypothetical protein